MKSISKILFLFFCLISLFGCNHKYFEKVQLLSIDDYNASLVVKKLKSMGVNVFEKSDNVGNSKLELFIPVNSIFNNNSANLNRKAYVILDEVVNLLGLYDEEILQVICNMQDNRVNSSRKSSLALARANQIVNYFVDDDVNASFMYADDSNLVPKGYIKVSFVNYKRNSK